jgi:hypothetical protein
MIRVVAPIAAAVAGAIATWFASRNSRKSRIKVGDIEVEGRTPQEIETMLAFIENHQIRVSSSRSKDSGQSEPPSPRRWWVGVLGRLKLKR